MPAETWGSILFQAQLVLKELANTGVTARSSEELRLLADQVDKIHTAARMSWANLRNGDLLDRAEENG